MYLCKWLRRPRLGLVGDDDDRERDSVSYALPYEEQDRARGQTAFNFCICKFGQVDQTGGNPGNCEVRNQTPQIQRRCHDRVPTKGKIGTLTPEGLKWFGCSGEIFPGGEIAKIENSANQECLGGSRFRGFLRRKIRDWMAPMERFIF